MLIDLQPQANAITPAAPPPVPLTPATQPVAKPSLWVVGACLAGTVWAFFPTFAWMFGKWVSDPQYSHGFLVPLFSGFLLWRKWNDGVAWLSAPKPLWAGAFFLAAFACRGLAGGLLFHQLDVLGLLVSLCGVAVAVGGWRLLARSASAIGFLVMMCPLPYEIERNVGGPLQSIATMGSTYFLQTLGYPAISQGNVIHIDEVQLQVVEACNGLKMLVTFTAFAVGAVLVLKRTWAEKLLILLGIVPIALFSNVLRIVVTGILCTMIHDEKTHTVIHDYAGYGMIVVGLGCLALQLWILDRLIVKPAADAPAPAFA